MLNEKVSWREYDKVGTILLLLFAVVYLMEHLSTWLTRLVQQERTLGRQGRRLLAGAAAALVLFCTVTLPPPDLSRTSMQMVKTLFTGLLHPNWELFFRLDSSGLAYLLLETVAIALVGTCVGAVFSVPLAFLGSSRLNYAIGAPVEKEIRYAMSNSLGFGGHNATLLVKKYEG